MCSRKGFYSRWAVLSSGIVVNAFATFSYAYGLFSGALKDDLGFGQDSISLIASFGELGLWSSFFVGLILESIPPHKVYWLASCFVTVGLMYIGLAIGKSVPATAESVAFAFFVASFGSACLGCAAQTTVVKNFPARDRGKLSGLIKSIFALSASVQGVLFIGLFGGEDAANFLIFLALFVSTLAVLTSFPLSEIPGKYAVSYGLERAQGISKSIKPYYWFFGTLTVSLVVCVITNGLGQDLGPWVAVAVIALVFMAFGLPYRYGRVWINTDDSADGSEGDFYSLSLVKEAEPLLGALAQSKATDKGEVNSAEDGRSQWGYTPPGSGAIYGEAGDMAQSRSGREIENCVHDAVIGSNRGGGACGDYDEAAAEGVTGSGAVRAALAQEVPIVHATSSDENLTWRQCLRDKRFYTLFVCFTCGAGAGITVINNIRQIAEADAVKSGNVLVSLLGIANALGRLGMGWVSDKVVKRGIPRAVMLCGTLLLTALVDLVLMAGSSTLIYPAVMMAGMAYGACFTLALALAGDLFGRKHLGTTYGLLDLGPAIGSFAFATGTVDLFYQGASCVGAKCFRGTFLVTASACMTTCFLAYFVLVVPVVQKGNVVR